MPQQEGEIIADAAELVVQIRVAHATGEDVHEGLPRAGIGNKNGFDCYGGVLAEHNCAFDLVNHEWLLTTWVPARNVHWGS